MGRTLIGVLVAVVVASWGVPAQAEDKKAPPPKGKPEASAPKAPDKPLPGGEPSNVAPTDGEQAPLIFHNESLIQRADGTVSYFYRTNFVSPADLIGALKAGGFTKLLGPPPEGIKENLRPVKGQNVLVIDGDSDGVEMVLDAIAYFDIATPQVFVEAKVLEITYDSNFEFGVNYDWSRDDVGPNTLFRGAGGILSPPSILRSGFPPAFPFQGSELLFGLVGKKAEKWGALDLAIQALQVRGKAEVLSKPSIIATQGVQATVQTTEERTQAILHEARTADTIFRTTSVKSGVTLTVTPTHIGDAFVTLKINPVVNGSAGLAVNQISGTFAPIQTTRSADTTVTLGDRETLVIGGLYTNTKTMERARTPFLSDVPVLGELFTRTAETNAKTELIFILTPHIVRKTKDLKIITPPAELERLEKEASKKDCKQDAPAVPPPPGWGAKLLDH